MKEKLELWDPMIFLNLMPKLLVLNCMENLQ